MVTAAYARYSTDLQQETSIIAQLQAIMDYCKAHSMEMYPQPYIDEARSGTNTDRPGYQALLADARAHKFDGVCVYDVSRGSRNVADWFSFRAEMSNLGIQVFSVTNTLGDSDDPNAFLTELITVGIGQHMVLQSRQKSIAGKRIKAQQGNFCGGVPPFGYRIENGKYEINDAEAPAVRLAFSMYAAGRSLGDIVEAIEAMGIRSRNGRRIERNTLHYMFINVRYTGKFVWFEKEERHMHKHVGRPGADPITIDGAIPRLVSDDEYSAVQERMKGNKKMSNAAKHTYLLAGLIRCGECGRAMSGVTVTSKGHTYKRYVCTGKRTGNDCELTNVDADVIERSITDQLCGYFLNPETIAKAADKILEVIGTHNDMRESRRFELQKINIKIARIVHYVENNDIVPPYMSENLADLTKRQKALEEQMDEPDQQSGLSREAIIEQLRADAQRLADDPEQLSAMVHKYVQSVVVYDNSIDVTWSELFDLDIKKDPASGDARLLNGWLPRYGLHGSYNVLTIDRSRLRELYKTA